MDDRSNTIAGWVLGAMIAALGSTLLFITIFGAKEPAKGKQGYVIDGVEDESGGGAIAAVALPVLLAAADPAKGEAVFKKCTACHTIASGGANGIGPNLWGVIGKPHGHIAGFAYSEGLKSKPGPWDFASIDEWLANPKKYSPGTKMTFAGLGKPEDRANVIVYLNNQGSNLPLPAVEAVAAPAEGAAAVPAGTEPAKVPAK
jgi:cytochrome c